MVRCTSFCLVNILKFIIYYFLSSYLYNIAREYLFFSPLFILLGLIFGILAFFTIYTMCINRAEIIDSFITIRCNIFRYDSFDLLSDSNYRLIEKANKLVIYHFNRKVTLKWYFKGYNRFKYYLLSNKIPIQQKWGCIICFIQV